MSRFSVETGAEISEATGQHSLALELVNRSSSRCFFRGYPRVVLRDENGVIPFRISHRGDQMVTSRPPTRVVVGRGHAAYVLVNNYRCDLGVARTARTLRISVAGAPANDAASLLISSRRRPMYCGRGDPGSILAVSPFEPTLRATLKHS